MKKIILSIDGMTCSACSSGLEKYLQKQDGILSISVNLVMANASISYDETKITLTDIESFIKKAGFQSLGEWREINLTSIHLKEKKKFLFFTILAIGLMYISMSHMLHLPSIPFLDQHQYPKNYMILSTIITISFLVYGFDILKNGYKNLIHKTPNMDTLVSIGVITSFLYSLYNMYLIIRGDTDRIMDLYFESSSIVIYFVKLGRYIDTISKNSTKEAIQKLVTITPEIAIIKKGKQLKEIRVNEINQGDIVICKAGEKIAVDGTIQKGKAHFDESFLTGESKPLTKEIGDRVLAGSLNYDGYIEYKAEKIGKESTISEIVKLVVEATNTKTHIATLADRVSGYFVPIIISLAIISLLGYLLIGKDPEMALTSFVTVLVIACPCSLGLATPLAMIVSEGMCASKGILVKNNKILENARRTNVVVFDKTGTLTYGKLKIANIHNASDLNEKELIRIIASIESKTTHPIKTAFLDYLVENQLSELEVESFQNLVGMGIKGTIKNQEYKIGSAKILEIDHIENNVSKIATELSKSGNSLIYVVKNKEIIALIGVNDIAKKEAKHTISTLRNMKIESIMLTGDNEETAKKIAENLGIKKVIANVSPKEKSETIKKLKEENQFIMMCGDGINDSPALALADIGISVSGATDIASDSSDVILLKNDLNRIVDLIQISKKTIHKIKQNLFWAFFYNCIMIPIAMGVLKPIGIIMNPMWGGLAMVLSSLTVILNTLKLKQK